jgi:LEA14-like dessication related protein
MSYKVTGVFFGVILLLSGCTSVVPKLQHPEVKVAGIHLLPRHGLEQHIALDLMILNPNKKELTVRSITYDIGIENIKLLSGMSDQVPALKSYQETPVTLEVSLDMIQGLRLIEYFARNGTEEKINYNFSATIDFSAWLPSLHVDKKGVLPLHLTSNQK